MKGKPPDRDTGADLVLHTGYRLLTVVTALVAVTICALGLFTFEQQKKHIWRQARQNLSDVNDIKVGEIVRWRADRLNDARILTENDKLIPLFADWLARGAPAGAERDWMGTRLETLRRGNNYATLSLLDARGNTRIALGGAAHVDAERKQLALLAMRQGQPFISHIHFGPHGKLEIDMIAPLMLGLGERMRPVGALYFEIDPTRYLFPLIQNWPSKNPSGETLLVRREGDEVVFLNQMRHQDAPPLSLRFPVSATDLPAAMAVRGQTGFVRGIDYRGQAVAAYLRPIPDTDWFLVAKIDAEEVEAPVRELALWTCGIALLLLGASFALLRGHIRRVQLALRNRQLRQEKNLLHRRFNDLSKFANDLFLLVDADGRLVEVNEPALEAYGYTHAEMLQLRAADLRASETRDQFDTDWQTVLAQGQANYESVHQRKDGSTFPVDVSARVLELDHQRFVQTILRDISERKQAEQRLHYLAYYDELTGLPNRALFTTRLDQAMAAADRRDKLTGVLFLDLDHFKHINDSLGHETGNALLCEVAKRLKTCFRETDTVARLGGDDFAVILAELSQVDDATHVARKVLQSFETPFHFDGHEVFAAVSIGITLYPLDGNDSRILLRNADAALYHAKSQGRGNFQFYSVELTLRAQNRMSLETGLRHALERGEFLLHYQPQIDLRSGQVVGVEALLRWDRPGQGLVSPAEFVPVAEESGLIVPIGTWALHTACAQAQAWRQAGHPDLMMAVNISSRQFTHGRLNETVTAALRDTGLPARNLELEITESVLMDSDDGAILLTLQAFQRMGITLAIDDFGTGYSSLSYLQRFPIDKLKIDQSFVRGLTHNSDDDTLVQAIIAMARSLRLTVVAEGVETQAQREHLSRHGCDQLQGYFISRPLPADQMDALLPRSLLAPP